MDDNQLKTGEKQDRNNKGQFIEGVSANPNGRPKGSKNKYTIDKLIEAIESEEALAKKEKAPGLFQMFARMAYTNPNVMISLMNKFVANKEKIEHSTDGPLEIDIKRVDAED